jgi:hypothetical protein
VARLYLEQVKTHFSFYKNVKGIKRHLYVDTLGNILFVHCTPANTSDDKGLIEMIKKKPVSTKKIQFF